MRRVLKTRKVHFLLALLGAGFVFGFFNMMMNFIVVNMQLLIQNLGTEGGGVDLNMVGFLLTFTLLPDLAYFFLGIISLSVAAILYYKLRTNFRELEEKHAKGSSRFTTLDEMKQQYKAVPEKKETYKGSGGVPISRYKNKIFVDDSPVNNLWVGTTRSGKGEVGMFPMIDVYSRAEKQASMVLNDPKGGATRS